MLLYIQYFFYVGLNWGWRIAFVIILQEIKGERKYGIHTTGADELAHLKKAGIDTLHATLYMPVSYSLLEQSFAQISTDTKKHFLDIGCGKGRALCMAPYFGFMRVTGVDFSPKFCEESRNNLAQVKQIFPVLQAEIFCADAAAFSINPTVDCIFLFNPFDEIIMERVVQHVKASMQERPREMNIIYANPLYKYHFEAIGFRQVYYSKKLEQFEVSILNCRP